jgi:hypothetical protein
LREKALRSMRKKQIMQQQALQHWFFLAPQTRYVRYCLPTWRTRNSRAICNKSLLLCFWLFF